MADTKQDTPAAEAKAPDQSELIAALTARVEAAEKAAAEAKEVAIAKAANPSAEHEADKPKAKRHALTKANSHRATRRGYVKGVLIEENAVVPADVPVSDEWMVPNKGAKLARAIDEAQDPSPKDVDYTQVGMPGLKVIAAMKGINPEGLSEDDLITAIKAEREATI